MKLISLLTSFFKPKAKPEPKDYRQIPYVPAGQVWVTSHAVLKPRTRFGYDMEWIDASSHVIDHQITEFNAVERWLDETNWHEQIEHEPLEYHELDHEISQLVRDCTYHDR